MQQQQEQATSLGEGELRQQWQAHANACRIMERDPQAFPPPLLATAKAQRDEAERRWRAAKTPHPLHKRLRWAQAELQEAEAKEANHRRELQDHLQTVERRTRELQDRLATSAARTARRRAALEAIRLEAAPGESSAAGEAARVAASGISMDVAPQLTAAIERLASPLGEDTETLRQHLQAVAASLDSVRWVLNTATERPADATRTTHYDISDDGAATATDGDKGVGGAGGGEDDRAGGAGERGKHCAAAVARWARAPEDGRWKKCAGGGASSAEAAEEARRVVRRLAEGQAHAGAAGSCTNDLAEAERRDRLAALQQFEAAQRQQQRQLDDQQRAQAEADLALRQRAQQEELQRHQSAMQKAAEARAAEEAKQRDALLASMSPQELARAAELHAQQAAMGAQVFGSQPAAQMAAMLQNAQSPSMARAEGGDADTHDEVDRLMEMSAEEWAAWDRERQGADAAALPW